MYQQHISEHFKYRAILWIEGMRTAIHKRANSMNSKFFQVKIGDCKKGDCVRLGRTTYRVIDNDKDGEALVLEVKRKRRIYRYNNPNALVFARK